MTEVRLPPRLNEQPFTPVHARSSRLIGIDSDAAARPHGQPDALADPLFEGLADFTSEYFVEWQVADHVAHRPLVTPEK